MRANGIPAFDYNQIALNRGRMEPERRPVKEKKEEATLKCLNKGLRELRVSYLLIREKEV